MQVYDKDYVDLQVRKAVAAEREACVDVIEKFAKRIKDSIKRECEFVARKPERKRAELEVLEHNLDLAKAIIRVIRARGKE